MIFVFQKYIGVLARVLVKRHQPFSLMQPFIDDLFLLHLFRTFRELSSIGVEQRLVMRFLVSGVFETELSTVAVVFLDRDDRSLTEITELEADGIREC